MTPHIGWWVEIHRYQPLRATSATNEANTTTLGQCCYCSRNWWHFLSVVVCTERFSSDDKKSQPHAAVYRKQLVRVALPQSQPMLRIYQCGSRSQQQHSNSVELFVAFPFCKLVTLSARAGSAVFML